MPLKLLGSSSVLHEQITCTFSSLDSLSAVLCSCGDFLTLIIRERSPASASSRTMFSSLSSIKDAWYFITLGWFNCCGGKKKSKTLRLEGRKKKQIQDMLVTLVTLRDSTVTLPNSTLKVETASFSCKRRFTIIRLFQFISKQHYQLIIRGSCRKLCNPLYFQHQLK